MYPLKIRCQESVRKTVHTVKMSAEPMSMEFLTERMWQRLLCVSWVRKKGIDVSQMTGIDFAAFKRNPV